MHRINKIVPWRDESSVLDYKMTLKKLMNNYQIIPAPDLEYTSFIKEEQK